MSAAPASGLGAPTRHSLTVDEIMSDPLTEIAAKYWAVDASAGFDGGVIQSIYNKDLNKGVGASGNHLMILELTGFLEKYLLPNFDSTTASFEHVMCIILMVLEKCRERVSVWKCFAGKGDTVAGLMSRIVRLEKERVLSLAERTVLTQFLICAFSGLEVDAVRQSVLKLASLPVWKTVNPGRVEDELKKFPALRRHWERLSGDGASSKKRPVSDGGEPECDNPNQTFLPNLVRAFVSTLDDASVESSADTVKYLERSIELWTDLMSQLPTRRFLRLVMLDNHVLVKCKSSALYASEHATHRLYRQLVDAFDHFLTFGVDDQSGLSLGRKEVEGQFYSRLQFLQRLMYKNYPETMSSFALSSVAAVGSPAKLRAHLAGLNEDQLLDVAYRLHLLSRKNASPAGSGDDVPYSRSFLEEIIVSHHALQKNELDGVNALSLYPTEALLWDETVLPLTELAADAVLALPKLNLQFLTFQDYLLRSFTLFRLESAYEIREDITDAVNRIAPKKMYDYSSGVRVEKLEFQGWSRMALPVGGFHVSFVSKPQLGSDIPCEVRAEVEVSLDRVAPHIRTEWDSLREHDIIFMITVTEPASQHGEHKKDVARLFRARDAVVAVRGAEVVQVLDEAKKPLFESGLDGSVRARQPVGMKRTFRILLDPAQYHADVTAGNTKVYESFNLVLRRSAKENNFKAVLETIRDVMNVATVGKAIPPWLHDVFLGYGDPAAATYRNLPPPYSQLRDIDFCDTFINGQHALSCFPDADVTLVDERGTQLSDPSRVPPPFRVKFEGDSVREKVTIVAYAPPAPGPYPEDVPRKNPVPFTAVQTEAIRSGCNPGLTLIVGPPGTGKTDVAVQIISNIYHNFPEQRTLLVTHSNHALNDLFEKIMNRDIRERDLVRLGQGERDLDTDSDFSKWGRVTATLELRMQALAEVDRLGASLAVPGDVGYTCETAMNFFRFHVTPKIADFRKKSALPENQSDVNFVGDSFPFSAFFETAPGGTAALFRRTSFAEDYSAAEGCLHHLQNLLDEVESYRPFELFRSQKQRTNFLLAKQAKIVAMTCTHAALTRRQLVELGFKYDNIIMEEAAQILEIETFIPMVLQNHDEVVGSRLKRVILIGDHNQLPPVVKNVAFQNYGNLDQSLFTRFVRLGIPTVELNKQGRSRPSIAGLYSWRYSGLGNMPVVESAAGYLRANAGFTHEFQLIDVPDLNGQGESQPQPHFYQNVAEAEYVVATFQYMRLLGYPAHSISILTTYNGQKLLIDDIIAARCASIPLFGRPKAVSTVDKYQGQQNDYVLLSLVRSRHVGHLRDVRRLVVAMSRARLGLYVFCRQSLFSRCYELSPTFSQFATRPSQLCLVPGETFPSTRSLAQSVDSFPVESVQQLSSIVQQMAITALHGARPAPQPEIGGFVSVDVTEEQTSTTTTTSVAMADNEDVVMSEHVTTVPIVDRDAEAAATPPPDDDHDVDTSSAIVPAALSPVPEPRASFVVEFDSNAGCVVVVNHGDASGSLSGYSLRTDDASAPVAFALPDMTLAPEDRVAVWAGKNAKKHGGEDGNVVWDHSPILDGVGEITLVNTDGAALSASSGRSYRVTVKIDALRDVVTVHNDATRQVQLKKWSLVIPGTDAKYQFADALVLKPSATLSVYCGKDADSHNLPPSEVCWTTDSLFVNAGTVVELHDKDNNVATTAVTRYGVSLRLAFNKPRGCVTVKNASRDSVDLSGYTLECDGLAEHFTFPATTVLAAFAGVSVSVSGTSGTLVWNSASVDTVNDAISLKDGSGAVAARCL